MESLYGKEEKDQATFTKIVIEICNGEEIIARGQFAPPSQGHVFFEAWFLSVYSGHRRKGYLRQLVFLGRKLYPNHTMRLMIPEGKVVDESGEFKNIITDIPEGCILVTDLYAKLGAIGKEFPPLLEQAVVTGPVTDADLTDGYDWQNHNLLR